MNIRILLLCAVGPTLIVTDDSNAQSCQTNSSASFTRGAEVLTAQHSGALLLVSEPAFVGGTLDAAQSKSVTVLEQGCHTIEKTTQHKRLWFAINNHSQFEAEQPAYVGLQVIKLFGTARPVTPWLTAYRNRKRVWYFNNRTVPTYSYRQWSYSLQDWNTKANDLRFGYTYEREVLPIFKGNWHASSRANEPTAWDQRDWWKVNVDLANSYKVILDNRLISFDPASEEVGKGIPFYVTVGDAKAIIIRYYSELEEQNSEVRLCFEDCEVLAKLTIVPQ